MTSTHPFAIDRDPSFATRAALPLVPVASPSVLLLDEATDCEFIELLGRFRDSGGLANLAEVASIAATRGRPVPTSASVAMRSVLAFVWQGTWWLPLFQFNLNDMTAKPGMDEVLVELSKVFDRVSLSRWFLQSNCSLRGRAPVQVIDVAPDEVVAAARLDRFVAAG